MNKIFKHFILGIFICSAISVTFAQGYIVPNALTNLGLSSVGYELDILHNPTFSSPGGSWSGFLLQSVGKTPPTLYTNTFLFDPLVDPTGVRVFLVSSNDPVSSQPILSQNYTELLFPNSYVFTNGVPFYLGLYTGNNPNGPVNGIYSDPLFGWVELVNHQGTIQFLGGALEYQGGGIYAGTQTIIPTPEPNELALAILGTALFAFRRLKK